MQGIDRECGERLLLPGRREYNAQFWQRVPAGPQGAVPLSPERIAAEAPTQYTNMLKH